MAGNRNREKSYHGRLEKPIANPRLCAFGYSGEGENGKKTRRKRDNTRQYRYIVWRALFLSGSRKMRAEGEVREGEQKDSEIRRKRALN